LLVAETIKLLYCTNRFKAHFCTSKGIKGNKNSKWWNINQGNINKTPCSARHISKRSAGSDHFLGQGQFSKIVNCCPMLLKFCTYMCRPRANIPVQYLNNRSDVTLVSMATIWPIIKDRALFVNNINIHTIITSDVI
jgi:hypothetical protein